jgi:hypothetical protein
MMTEKQFDHLREFDQISRAAQRRLQARIADAHGDIDSVGREIRAQIEQLDRGMDGLPDKVRRSRQADRAFFVGQLAYLDALQHASTEQAQAGKPSFLAWLKSAFRRTETAG